MSATNFFIPVNSLQQSFTVIIEPPYGKKILMNSWSVQWMSSVFFIHLLKIFTFHQTSIDCDHTVILVGILLIPLKVLPGTCRWYQHWVCIRVDGNWKCRIFTKISLSELEGCFKLWLSELSVAEIYSSLHTLIWYESTQYGLILFGNFVSFFPTCIALRV